MYIWREVCRNTGGIIRNTYYKKDEKNSSEFCTLDSLLFFIHLMYNYSFWESFTECKNRILSGSGLMGRVSYEKFIYIKEIVFCRLWMCQCWLTDYPQKLFISIKSYICFTWFIWYCYITWKLCSFCGVNMKKMESIS